MEIDQIIRIWLKNKELIRILKFEDNVKNRSKCWNLSAKCQVDQNAEIRVKKEVWSKCPNLSERGESIKTLKFKDKVGINQNAEIWVLMVKLIKMLKFEWNNNNQWKCWNLSEKEAVHQMFIMFKFTAKVGIDQNVEICLKTKESIRILKFEDKMGIDQNVEIWVLIVKIYQNVDIWVKSWKTIKKLMF